MSGWRLAHAGKVRDVYRPQDPSHADVVMLLATDRVSAFDRALAPAIPGKGRELTVQTEWWRHRLPISTDVDDMPDAAEFPEVPAEFSDRVTVARRLQMIPVECVARGYLVGSAWAQYREYGRVGGRLLARGLEYGERLDDPLFTPTTKAAPGGVDQPLTDTQFRDDFGPFASRLAELTLTAYRDAETLARSRGLLIADVKFEFGVPATGGIVFADELVTGDSSRPMSAGEWEQGRIRFYGKENIREWLRGAMGPDSTPVVELPPGVVRSAALSYAELTACLTQTG